MEKQHFFIAIAQISPKYWNNNSVPLFALIVQTVLVGEGDTANIQALSLKGIYKLKPVL